MRTKPIFLFSLIFFLLVNTSYFWEHLPGLWDFGIALVLFLGYFLMMMLLIRQIYFLLRNKSQRKANIFNILILSSVLATTIIFPLGVFNFEKLEGKDLMVAYREGAGGCSTTLFLKENSRIIKKTVCFGIDRYEGTYKMIEDTIKFTFDNDSLHTSFGIIKLDSSSSKKYLGELLYFDDQNDERPINMLITKYELQ